MLGSAWKLEECSAGSAWKLKESSVALGMAAFALLYASAVLSQLEHHLRRGINLGAPLCANELGPASHALAPNIAEHQRLTPHKQRGLPPSTIEPKYLSHASPAGVRMCGRSDRHKDRPVASIRLA